MEAETLNRPTLMGRAEVMALDPEKLGDAAGVSHRVLWHDGTSMAGILRLEGGSRLGVHAHRHHHHHVWVLEGRASILGRWLDEGSYAHIPSGVEHDIDATGTGGCTVLYLYLRYGS